MTLLGKHPSETARKKMSIAHLGKKLSEKTRQIMREKFKPPNQ